MNDDEEMFDFGALRFDLDEEDVADEAIMSGKQYKILNYNMNMILLFLIDSLANISSTVNKEEMASIRFSRVKDQGNVQGCCD